MTRTALAEKPRRAPAPAPAPTKPAAKPKAAPPQTDATIARVVPSAPQIVQLRDLRRAEENVRHTRVDEDVAGLADDIAAHGLLQGLIGYRDARKLVQIVGGGRRFQALRELENRGLIDGDFPVPVLLRGVDEAIELSLAENLQQRTMSPVDEFLAFQALTKDGTRSPGDLAKRFGFTERVVRQRLRLADLTGEVLDALAGREITLDVAMAYASSQDQALQAEVFKAEKKRSWDPHRVHNIRYALAAKSIRTDSPLFRFVGEESYERRGGRYDDDLFNEPGKERLLATPFVLQTAAAEMIDFQMLRLLPEFQKSERLSPSITGYVTATDLRIKPYGNAEKLKVPAGFVVVEKYEPEKMWRTIRNNGIEAHILVGIDDKGELTVWPRLAIVPKAQRSAIDPPEANRGYVPPTPEEQAAQRRAIGIARIARHLAVPRTSGTPFEGRAFWPDQWDDRSKAVTLEGVNGWMVSLQIFATDAEIAAVRGEAEAEYERDLAAQAEKQRAEAEAAAAADRRRAELEQREAPAVVVVDGEAWARDEDGSYAPIDDEDGGSVGSWLSLLANFDPDDVGELFDTREAFDAAMQAATSSNEEAGA